MRRATVLFACLLLAGCSSAADDPKPAVTVTETAAPSLSAADAEQACVDAWLSVMMADGYDPDAEPVTPTVCEGLPGQAGMYMEALRERNAENRARLDECLEDLSCTSVPVP